MASDEAGNLARYQRQMRLAGVGVDGQRRLSAGHAIVVGVGALGCASADLLVRAGVGRVTLVDRDVVELTNLQRQTLFDERDAADGAPKAEAARRRLASVNSSIRIDALVADLTGEGAERLLGSEAFAHRGDGVTVLVDGTDNFETRYVLNDLAVKHGVAFCYGGVVGTTGMQMTVLPEGQGAGGGGACVRCVFEEPPEPGSGPTCDTAGVLGSVVAIVAGAQVSDAMKVLLGRVELVSRTLLEFDVWANRRRRLDVARREGCPCCGERRFEFLERSGGDAAMLCGQNAVQVSPGRAGEVDLSAWITRVAGVATETRNLGVLARARIGELEITLFRDGRAIVKGTDRLEVARSAYAKYVGS